MKKITAALGILSCALAGSAAAQTNVTVGGLVDVFAGSVQYSGEAGRRAVVNSGGMTTSWFGFKGNEDLGGGLKAEFALTGFFQGDTGASGRFGGDTLFSRDANVALAGGFGRVELGRGLAPNFLPTVLFNPFGDSFSFSPLVIHGNVPTFAADGSLRWGSTNAADTGWSNQIIYTTPKLGGLTANVHYQFGEQAGDTGINNVGINALYFNGPIGLTAFYHDAELRNPIPAVSATRQKTVMVGGSYDFKVVKAFATWQRNKNELATTGAEASTDKLYSLGLSAPVGNGNVLAAYANTKRDLVAAADTKRNTFSVGYDYFLSKRTDVYGVVMADKLEGFDRETSVGLGIRHRF
ncbi:porin [Noviherbaspirillum aridicola]|uniref:Porin n=1 Tax=Noviherbaspirillum aridicola TaxID=2849687 RepID=A0ABQ4Q5M6_9BURK|nr:porin [Noviherbaspirillum aridicola]GIZ52359.1 porin [Noviherbaspirillum aridicola]